MRKIRTKKVSILIVSALLGMTLLAGCGDKAASTNKRDEYSEMYYESTTAADYKNGLTYDGDYDAAYEAAYGSDDVDYEPAYDEAADYEENYDEPGDKGGSTGTDKEQSTNKIDTEKLVYRCNLQIQTLEYDKTVSDFKTFLKDCNGFLEAENSYINNKSYYNEEKLHTYTATVRIPSDKYEEFVSKSDGLGEIISKTQNVTNMSQEYSDLSVQLDVLAAERASYVEMLKQAKDLDDMDNILIITDKITDIDIQVAQIKTRLNGIDNDVAYSYVDVSIKEVKEYVTDPEPEDTFATRFTREVKGAWKKFFYGLQNFAIWFVSSLPTLIILFLIGFGAWKLIIKRIIKKAKANKKAREEKRAANPYRPGYPYPAYPVQAPVANAPAAPANAQPAAANPANAKPAADKTDEAKADDKAEAKAEDAKKDEVKPEEKKDDKKNNKK